MSGPNPPSLPAAATDWQIANQARMAAALAAGDRTAVRMLLLENMLVVVVGAAAVGVLAQLAAVVDQSMAVAAAYRRGEVDSAAAVARMRAVAATVDGAAGFDAQLAALRARVAAGAAPAPSRAAWHRTA